MNPGFLVQFGCISVGSSGSAPNNLTVYGTMGTRFVHLLPSSLGLFVTPSVGVMAHGEVQLAAGISLELYIVPKIFLGAKYLSSLGSINSSYSPEFSFIAFVVGYGVN
jgi:hypothetical protein